MRCGILSVWSIFKYAGNCCCGGGHPSTPHHGETSQQIQIIPQARHYWSPSNSSLISDCIHIVICTIFTLQGTCKGNIIFFYFSLSIQWSTGELGQGTRWDGTRWWWWNQMTMTTRSAMPTVTSVESWNQLTYQPLQSQLEDFWSSAPLSITGQHSSPQKMEHLYLLQKQQSLQHKTNDTNSNTQGASASVNLRELSWIDYWMPLYHLQSCLPLLQNSTMVAPLAAPKFNLLHNK